MSTRRSWRRDRNSVRPDRGEDYIHYVKRKTEAGELANPNMLISELGLLRKASYDVLCQVVKDQFSLADRRKDEDWMRIIRREAVIIFPDRWIDDNLYSSSRPKKITRQRKSRPSSSIVSSCQMCKDVRLLTDPSISVVRENAAEDAPPEIREPSSPPVPDKSPEKRISPVRSASDVLETSQSVSEVLETSDQEIICNRSSPNALVVKRKTVKRPITVGTMTFVSSRYRTSSDHTKSSPSKTRKVKLLETETPAKRPKVDSLQVTVARTSAAKQQCPIPGCMVKDRKIKRHMYQSHFPRIFQEDKPRRTLSPSDLCDQRLNALKSLIRCALGATIDFPQTITYLNNSGMVPESSTIHPETHNTMMELCNHQGWECPEIFHLHSINSPAVLIHWRCLSAFFTLLSANQREQFRRTAMIIIPEPTCVQSDVSVHPDEEFQGFTVVGSDVNNNTEKEENLEEAFDSHFHLDRTSMRLFRSHQMTVEDILKFSASGNSYPSLEVAVLGGVMIFSEPNNYPEIPTSSSTWKVAVGVHPKHIEELTSQRFHYLATLMESSHITALGEIGLDRSVPAKHWRSQEEVFCRVLSLARKDKPIVLHVCGTKDDKIGMDVHARCMQIFQKQCHPDQPIHIHCFTGDRELVKEWMDSYRNVYFGLTGAVRKFSTEQREGLKYVPMSRLLLETDSPYMHPGGGDVNTPAFIGDVATLIATQLNVSVSYILRQTFRNGHALYGS